MFAQPRLDRNTGALAEPDLVFVRLFLREKTGFAQHFGRFLARGETIQPVEFRHVRAIDFSVRMKDVDDRQVVALPDLEIDLVVRGRDLEHAGAEVRIDRLVADDGQLRPIERPPDLFA